MDGGAGPGRVYLCEMLQQVDSRVGVLEGMCIDGALNERNTCTCHPHAFIHPFGHT